MWIQTAIVATIALAMFVAVDMWFARGDAKTTDQKKSEPIRVHGSINFLLIALIVAAILGSAAWQPGVTLDIYGTKAEIQNLARDAVLIVIALASLKLTRNEHRAANGFTWEPIREVTILFAGIFTAIIPVLAMLQAGENGAFAWLLTAVTARDGLPHEAAYFWLTGILSAFLDNAPTYLVFFELTGGNAPDLMGPLAGTLASISMGAVYMGALTYIGNAPNFMIYAIAQERGVRMPNFFGYLMWASLILVPLFVLLTLLPIAPLFKWSILFEPAFLPA
jgi:Na+/H+ antiporter NhaD/arsenite permease-like protein